MTVLFNIWKTIVETNTFNFVVFALIILFIVKKINLSKIISDMRDKTENSVNSSKEEKNKSEKNLKSAQKKMSTVEKEVETIISDSKKTAGQIAKNIVSKAQDQIDVIESNAKKVMKDALLKTNIKLSGYAAKTSLNIMENNLKQNLANNKDLHNQFINEAIDELEKMEI